MTETQRKRKVWTWLKANGWANVGPGQWSNGTRTIDLDAAMVRDGKLRATWAVIEDAILNERADLWQRMARYD